MRKHYLPFPVLPGEEIVPGDLRILRWDLWLSGYLAGMNQVFHLANLVGVGVYFFRDDDGLIRHSTVSPWTR